MPLPLRSSSRSPLRALRALRALRRVAVPLLLAFVSFMTPELPAQPPAVGARARTFDHGVFDRLLRTHVRDGMVDYDAFAASPELTRYLASLAAADVAALPRDERLALWINAYNAYTIRLITKHGERASIRNINKSFGFVKAYGPWKEKLAAVGGATYGLDEIEQDIIRPRFREPRTHFALVCAAMGCPPLRSEAYVGARLSEQLDDQARTFLLRSPAKNRVDVEPGERASASLTPREFLDGSACSSGSRASACSVTSCDGRSAPRRASCWPPTGRASIRRCARRGRCSAVRATGAARRSGRCRAAISRAAAAA